MVISILVFLKGRHHHFSALIGLSHVYVNDEKCVNICTQVSRGLFYIIFKKIV